MSTEASVTCGNHLKSGYRRATQSPWRRLNRRHHCVHRKPWRQYTRQVPSGWYVVKGFQAASFIRLAHRHLPCRLRLLFGGYRYTYRSIITNDWDSEEKNVIETYNKRGARERLRPSQQWLRMEASAMLLLEREHRVHDADSLLHEFLLVFHKSCVIRIHQLVSYVKSQEVWRLCLLI